MDIEYLLFLQGLRDSAPDFVNGLLYWISWFPASPLPLLIAAVLFWCVEKRFGYMLCTNFVSSYFANSVLKPMFCVYRPFVRDSRVIVDAASVVDATGYSFPSGHVSIATAIYGTVIERFKGKKLLVAAMVLLIAITAFSRNWLGCHTPQDVIASCVVSIVVMIVAYFVVRLLEKRPELDIAVAAVMILMGIVALAWVQLKAYPLDYDATGALIVDPSAMQTDSFKGFGAWIGFAIAFVIERRFVHYEIGESTRGRVLVGIIGVVLLALLYVVVLSAFLNLFLDDHWAHFFKYLLTVLFAVAIYPACVMAVRKARLATHAD